jgi:hypothetical protein
MIGSKAVAVGLVAGLLVWGGTAAKAASYIFADDGRLDLVTHAKGYTGAGGALTVTVGIDQASAFASQIAVSIQNAVNTFNALIPTVNNFSFGQIASDAIDFESVFLHELGHSLGLNHFNLASESSLGAPRNRGAKTTDGADDTFYVDPGADGVYGSSDDLRGDDQNLIYFNAANDPFVTDLGIVDSTTYSRDVGDLPAGDLAANIGSREVAALLGYGNTEAVMVQGFRFGEVQRTLAAQDVAGILYAQSGLDSIAGTEDDYDLNLQFVGTVDAADILVGFANTYEVGGRTEPNSYAVSVSSAAFIPGSSNQDAVIIRNNIYFNDTRNWFFNQQSNLNPVPLPASVWGLVLGLAGFAAMRRRAAKTA